VPDAETECQDMNITFYIFYSIDFFLMFMVQIIFLSNTIAIFTVFPARLKKKMNGFVFEYNKKNRTKAFSGKMSFSDWYYSFDYMVAFITSIFTLVLVFSSSVPLIIPLGLIFFIIKFNVDVN
jgi:hypothetical protein